MRRPGRIVGALVLVLGVALVAVFGLKGSSSAKHERRAPALPGEQLSGGDVTLTSLLAAAHGRASLVVFWASWCDPCHREANAIEEFSKSSEGRGRVVGVDWSDSAVHARSFIRQYHWTFPVLRDGKGFVGSSYGLRGLPTTFVVDGDGRIREALVGPQTTATLKRALASA